MVNTQPISLRDKDFQAWLANPLTKALKQSHREQAERDTALLRQCFDTLEELQYATTDKAFAMADATIAALRERLGVAHG